MRIGKKLGDDARLVDDVSIEVDCRDEAALACDVSRARRELRLVSVWAVPG